MPAASITDGFDVLVQLVIAAMTIEPCSKSNECPLFFTDEEAVFETEVSFEEEISSSILSNSPFIFIFEFFKEIRS